MPLSVQEFAAKVKAKYPEYQSLADDDLARRIVAKYPEYEGQVSLAPSVAEKAQQHLAVLKNAPAEKTFGGGLYDSTIGGFVDTAKSAIGMNGPAAAAKTVAGVSIPGMVWNAAKGAYEQYNQAMDAAKNRDLGGAFGHMAAAMVPVVGPAAANAGEHIKQGDIGYGLGEATGLIGQTLLPGALGKKVTAAGPALDAAGDAQYQRVIDPQNVNPSVAAPVARELAGEGVRMRNPQAELGPILNDKANAVDTSTPILGRTMPTPVSPITQALRDARANLFDANGTVRHGMQPVVDGLSALEKEIEAKSVQVSNTPRNVGTIPNEALKNLHQDLSNSAGRGGQFDPAIQSNPDRWSPDMHGANAVMDAVNADPAAAAANAKKSAYIKANRELLQRDGNGNVIGGPHADTLPTKGRVATTLGGAAAMEVAGMAFPPIKPFVHVLGRMLDLGGATKLVTDALRSPAWNTRSAIIKKGMARAIATKDYGSAATIASAIAELEAQENRDNGQ